MNEPVLIIALVVASYCFGKIMRTLTQSNDVEERDMDPWGRA